ncbi:GDSL-type esterase/lipase family protein [Spongiivirga citrea]|uniref:G-D-S-L family lipolytic protein n=1 Tax=Spongiivirga citrea TaxID=1481457 RepID=A0A6M0CPE5_9FLAO|nr:GDSL-type esterase/lipase family protein [Spongiivirga citrea]NER17739.1 G-D-S-L family lipolytic protein [Spongiivirga citrea]
MRLTLTLFILFPFFIFSQQKRQLKKEVKELSVKYISYKNRADNVVFTGSSSIRMWHSLNDTYPSSNILNTGFGGSEMSDLLRHRNRLIKDFKPTKLFVYEGDNDIARGKTPEKTLRHFKRFIKWYKRRMPNTELYIISPKPSIARWHFKGEYLKLNKELKALCDEEGLAYIDVWLPMINNDRPIQDVFLDDDLHMNEKGYEIWRTQIDPYIEK